MAEEYFKCEKCKQIKPVSEQVRLKIQGSNPLAFLKGMNDNVPTESIKYKSYCRSCIAKYNKEQADKTA